MSPIAPQRISVSPRRPRSHSFGKRVLRRAASSVLLQSNPPPAASGPPKSNGAPASAGDGAAPISIP